MGPYRFREEKHKVNITWNNKNQTVTFNQQRFWHFDDENSNGSLTDIISTVNVIALVSFNNQIFLQKNHYQFTTLNLHH